MSKKDKKTSWLKKNSITICIFLFFLIIIVPILISISLKWIDQIVTSRGWTYNLLSFDNQTWWAFWGSYVGGIATLAAVWWTVSHTERHFRKTIDFDLAKYEEDIHRRKEEQRLRVLPVLILQPLKWPGSELVTQSLDKSGKKENIVNSSNSDLSPMTINLGREPNFRVGDLNNNEIDLPPSMGLIMKIINGGVSTAINVIFKITSPLFQKEIKAPYIISLSPKERITVNMLIDTKESESAFIIGDYALEIRYSDIYQNRYEQIYKMNISIVDGKYAFTIHTKVEPLLLASDYKEWEP